MEIRSVQASRDARENFHLVVLVDRLGPYHVARLKCVADLATVTVVEAGSRSDEYRWEEVITPASLQRITLFQGAIRRVSSQTLTDKLCTALHDLRANVVVIPGWADRTGLISLQYCLLKSIPLVIMSDSNAMDAKRYWLKETVKKRILSLLGSALAGGERSAEYIAKLGMPKERIFLGYDVVDNAYFAQGAREARENAVNTRRQLGLPERYFLASSRFIPKKNLSRLLQAYSQYKVLQAEGSWKLVVLGNGDLWAELHEQRHKLGLDDDVIFPGFIQYDRLPAYYGLAGAFVHVSVVEQWGLVVNEALASGLPVVVSERCGCVPELVQEGRNGFTFNPLDPDRLANLMVNLTNRTDLNGMATASEEIIRDWSPEKFADNLLRAAKVAIVNGPKRIGFIDRLLLRVLIQ